VDLNVRLLARLAKDAAVYGIGSLAQGALLFLLLPVYTRVLPREAYGAFALLLGLLYAGEILFRSGLHYAFLTLAPHEANEEGRRRIGRTAWSALAVQAGVLFLALLPAASPLSRWLTGSPDHAGAVRLILVHLLITTPVVVKACLLRSAGRPKAVVGLSVGQLAVTFACSLGLVAGFGRGVQGAFEGYALGSLVFGLATAVPLLRDPGFGFDHARRRDLYRLGVSYTAAQLLLLGVAYSGRYLLRAFATLHEVALYDVAYKMGMLLTLLVGPFSVAWTSGLFDVARSERPQEAFASVFKYLMSLLAWAGLGISLLAPEGILLLGGRPYAEAAEVVPLVATGFVLAGASSFLGMGPALARSSRELVTASASALVAGVGLCILLIRPWGLWGAATAAFASALVQAASMLRGAQRCYKVAYPWPAMGKLTLLYGASIALGATFLAPSRSALALRLAVLASFPAQLLLCSVFDQRELDSLRRLPLAMLSRAARTA
jgi:O-antigen/teichoic acid export membrane protein